MLEVSPVRAFSDNYIWLIRTPGDPSGAAVVDPGDARPVEDALEQQKLALRSILVTHHHPDRVGGVRELVSRYGAPVLAPAREEIPCASRGLSDGEQVTLAGTRAGILRDSTSPATPRGTLPSTGTEPSSAETRSSRGLRTAASRDDALEQAVNCVHATRRPCHLRSGSNDVSIRPSLPGTAVKAAAAARAGRTVDSVEEVFAVIRSWKDGFR